jgi:hypothetical protein
MAASRSPRTFGSYPRGFPESAEVLPGVGQARIADKAGDLMTLLGCQ